MSNLTRTTEAILAAVREAKANSAYIIVFVTGIPGAVMPDRIGVQGTSDQVALNPLI
jgi:hypothetical protein